MNNSSPDEVDPNPDEMDPKLENVQMLLSGVDDSILVQPKAISYDHVGEDDPATEIGIWKAQDPRDSQDFAQLVKWVDQVVIHFELEAYIPPCWWRHAAITQELKSLWALGGNGNFNIKWLEALHASINRIIGRHDWGWNSQNCGMNSGHISGKALEWRTDTSGHHRHNLDQIDDDVDVVDEAEAILNALNRRAAQARLSEDQSIEFPEEPMDDTDN